MYSPRGSAGRKFSFKLLPIVQVARHRIPVGLMNLGNCLNRVVPSYLITLLPRFSSMCRNITTTINLHIFFPLSQIQLMNHSLLLVTYCVPQLVSWIYLINLIKFVEISSPSFRIHQDNPSSIQERSLITTCTHNKWPPLRFTHCTCSGQTLFHSALANSFRKFTAHKLEQTNFAKFVLPWTSFRGYFVCRTFSNSHLLPRFFHMLFCLAATLLLINLLPTVKQCTKN